MRKILLILGCVAGSAAVLFGVLGLIGGLTDPTLSQADLNDTIAGAIFFIVIGLTVLVPCVVFLILSGRRTNLPAWQPGLGMMPGGVAAPYGLSRPAPDLRGSYLEWFGWCQREVGGTAIALHSATMAALARAMAGDTGGATQAARRAAQLSPPTVPGVPKPARGGKVRVLARVGAGTLPLLEPGETVVVSLYGTDSSAQMWRFAFGWLGYLIAASQGGAYFLTVTDRRVILLTGPQLGLNPQALAFAVSRSVVSEAQYRKGLLNDRLTIARVTGERTRLRVHRMWRDEGTLAAQTLAPGLVQTPLPAPPLSG